MALTRREFGFGVTAGALARPVLAAAATPLKIGYLAALTGPASAPTQGFHRGIDLSVEDVNAAGGTAGRMVELIVRDTQGDPTKAVNAAQELIGAQKVHAIVGPANSGEALATTPIMARFHMPNVHACFVDSLIDTTKYPNAIRNAPTSTQLDDATRHYVMTILKQRDIAVMGDTTGYGTSATASSVAAFKAAGANVVYQAQLDATQPDVKPDLLRSQAAGAKVIVLWSVSTGMLARLMNVRAQLGWNIPFVGHPALGAGEIRDLLDKPANWDNVFTLGFRNCTYEATGKLPPRTAAFVARLRAKQIAIADTVLWWIASGYDQVQLVAKAVAATGSSDPDAIVGYWNTLNPYPGIYGDYRYSAQNHNGFPADEIVMSLANSAHDGAYTIAPGYGAT
jgi:branched-chain amino acid transport system substrate-binding protein